MARAAVHSQSVTDTSDFAAPLATPRRTEWYTGTVTDVIRETACAKTFVLSVPGWPGHAAGQHVDVRLGADNGHLTPRSYSIASEPSQSTVAITIERLDNGKASAYLTDALGVGDRIELRGPIGAYFVWEPSMGGPLFLVAGGSGIVPLMAMLRTHATAGLAVRSAAPATLLYAARSWDDVIYRDEVLRLAADGSVRIVQTLTRSQPPGWDGFTRRIDADMLAEVAPEPSLRPHIYISGPAALVETVSQVLLEFGHEPARVRTERFGSTR